MKRHKVIYKEGSSEITEKKSSFLASAFPLNAEEEALCGLERIKKQHPDARHHCFAYVLGENNEIQRASDDGEPSGTAGKPILDILLGAEVHNAIIVVTRYFGGTLLGTGGLARAYSKAAREAMSHAQIVEKCPGRELLIRTDYHGIGKVRHIIGQTECITLDAQYTETVTVRVLAAAEAAEEFGRRIAEATAGRSLVETVRELYYGETGEKEFILF